MAHKGARRDSMGVGLYGCTDKVCSQFNRGVVDAAMDPSTFLPVASSSGPLCLRTPWNARVWVLEMSLNDDRRLFGKMPEALDRVLQANYHACWAAGSTPNVVKLKGFPLALEVGVIWYLLGAWDCYLGPVGWEKEGLLMTRIPLIQTEAQTDKLWRIEQRLYCIVRALRSLCPFCIVVLRRVVA